MTGCGLETPAKLLLFASDNILEITECEIGFSNFTTEKYYTEFFWQNPVLEFGLDLFFSV